MKKFSIFFILCISIIFASNNYTFAANCQYDIDGNPIEVGDALDSCLQGSDLVMANDVAIDGAGGFGIKIKNWVDNISIYLGVFAVGSIVFGALKLTLSSGEDEKIKKAKDIIKWGIFGFIGLILVYPIINLVIKIMYSI